MSKASLIVGNSNWAIKDSSLLGYNINDSNIYSPFPFDVTRATPATRVDKAGLIVTDEEILSGELVTNGSFDTDSDWTFIGTTEISNGVASFPNSTNSFLIQSNVFDLSVKTYKLQYKVVTTNGNNFRLAGGNSAFGLLNLDSATIGFKTVYITSNGTKQNLQFNNNTFIGSIDIVSVVEVNQNNLARIDYLDSTKGVLLTEPQSTNTTIQSQAISNLSIFAGGVSTHTVTDNYTTSPNGGMNASRFQATRSSSDADSALIRTGNIGTGDVTVSFYAKSLTGANQNMLSYIADAGVGEVFVVTSEWKRFVVSGNQATNNIALIGTRGGSGQFYNGGDENLDIAVWGIQTENLPYATSIIPTSGSTVTRNADQVYGAGDVSTFNSTEGTLFGEFSSNANDNNSNWINISDGTNSNWLFVGRDGTNVRTYLKSNNVVVSSDETNLLADNNKVALSYKSGDIRVWINGVKVVNLTSAFSFSSDLNQLNFGLYNGGATTTQTSWKQVQVFNTILTDAELIKLTTI